MHQQIEFKPLATISWTKIFYIQKYCLDLPSHEFWYVRPSHTSFCARSMRKHKRIRQ